jgi:hypothetical protein
MALHDRVLAGSDAKWELEVQKPNANGKGKR